MQKADVAKTAVCRWQERFMQEGADGLLRDKTRPSRIPPLAPEIADRVVALTIEPPPGETTHWTALAMAKAGGFSVSSVQRIWRAHGLRPHRLRQFRLSNDPNFAAKLRDVVGLYIDPPAHAVVLSMYETMARWIGSTTCSTSSAAKWPSERLHRRPRSLIARASRAQKKGAAY